MDIAWFILIGLCAGWLASQLVKGGSSGALSNLIVGVTGAILGGFLLGVLGFTATNLLGRLISATLGAIVLILMLRAFNRRR